MAETAVPQGQASFWKRRGKRWVMKLTSLLLAGVLFGSFHAWAEPKFYLPGIPAGFGYGILHGALMPIALPSLLVGKDVAIYAENNLGRVYKLGYIVGINFCGLVFFGLAFGQPRRRSSVAQSDAESSR